MRAEQFITGYVRKEPKVESKFTDLERAVMEGGHSLEKTVKEGIFRSALRQAVQQVDEQPTGLTFKGYPCTKDCTGHQAGYRWAHQKGVISDTDCPGMSTHPSFWEGCKSKTEGK